MLTDRPINSFRCLTFDCYGTLVDWESGIYHALQPLIQQLPTSHPLREDRLATLRAFVKHEGIVQTARPKDLYSSVLAAAYGGLAEELGLQASEEAKTAFGASVGDWPAFPDTVEALKRLKKHYKLVILSNVDINSFSGTLSRQLTGVEFDAIYTAQDIGSYKPSLNNFHYLIEHVEKDLGVEKKDILHTAQSLHHDHVPAHQVDLVSAWIERGDEVESVMGGDPKDFEGRVSYTWHFRDMVSMADIVDAAASQ
ncbi:Haloacid dehalogenase-like hydrolase-domain-containing protein [Stachybotrys elegans]|uniref:Haloacid dehalogenase-like hydrolase-domain-containing protein n=1 Tax=Stachybotrys elegans TaxID=80388 RepID=A0A8K0WTX2_9HYPO|nr:Haloacid dehalogenase-like hydrolase-domain-containing protein [Stachybotrys elegans]